MSAGVRGFRVGAGPRGNYVHMGAGGLYYRAALPVAAASDPPATPEVFSAGSATHAPLSAIGSADVSGMIDSSSSSLLAELNDKHRRTQAWPWVAGGSVLACIILVSLGTPEWGVALAFALLAAGTFIAFQHDLATKSVVVLYDFEPAMEEAYERLHECLERMARCDGHWHLRARGQVYDQKYHAGASHLLDRKPARIGLGEPPYVRTNIAIPSILLRGTALYFFPERLLVYTSGGVGAVPYGDLRIVANESRMIEAGAPPRDAQTVGHTWQYVNKSGGPDRRFKSNRELPICLYEELGFSSGTGLNEIVQLSRIGLGNDLEGAVQSMADQIRRAGSANKKDAARPKQAAPQPPLPSVDRTDVFEALLDVLGCIMVADGRASRNEKKRISQVLRSLRAPWSDDEIESRISAFIAKVQSEGHRRTLAAALSSVDVFRQRGQQDLLLTCLDSLAKADESADERETQLINRIRALIREAD